MTRTCLFISHANPEDNNFALWLGAKLGAMGYEVWADLLNLKGGHDWQRELESALRHRALKILWVATQEGVKKQGVRNELQIAAEVGKKIADDEFIIPLRLSEFESPFVVAQAQYIDFSGSWVEGLSHLKKRLEECNVPRSRIDHSGIWQSVHLQHSGELTTGTELLVSNWLSVSALPTELYRYDFKSGISIGKAQSKIQSAPIPVVSHKRGFISFATLHELSDHFGSDLPLDLLSTVSVEEFLAEGWATEQIQRRDARNKFGDLTRQALEAYRRFVGHSDPASEVTTLPPKERLALIRQILVSCLPTRAKSL